MSPLVIVTLVAALGAGLIAGAFFAFSSFIMRGLAAIPPATGVAAMRSINVTVLNAGFLGLLLGTGLLSLGLAIWAGLNWGGPGAWLRLLGGAAYLFGTLGVTMGANVPRNNALAALEPDSPAAAAYWPRYLREWTALNSVRTLAALLATALFLLANQLDVND